MGFWGVDILYAFRDVILVQCACPARDMVMQWPWRVRYSQLRPAVKYLEVEVQLWHECECFCSSIKWLYVTHKWVWCYVHLLTLQKPHIPANFNMYLVINTWVTAVKVSKFSGHYLRNRSTLDIGVLGYIGIVWPKEHSPEVSHILPVIPCIYDARNFADRTVKKTVDNDQRHTNKSWWNVRSKLIFFFHAITQLR